MNNSEKIFAIYAVNDILVNLRRQNGSILAIFLAEMLKIEISNIIKHDISQK